MRTRNGFTLLEMLTTVALLTILLGLMVDLAGYVRNRSATDLARQVLSGLDQAMQKYFDAHDKTYPDIHPFTKDPNLGEDEQTLFRNARLNNQDFVAALKSENLLEPGLTGELPASIYDGSRFNDAWDMPIVFIPASHGKIGMAPSGRGFFFSAGPDRLYKTREDNLYSYEVSRVTE
jgi:prepilin-type N-terminal cleavage/methylation domain-containing protein